MKYIFTWSELLFGIAWYGFDKSKQAGNGTSINSNVSFNSITDSKIIHFRIRYICR